MGRRYQQIKGLVTTNYRRLMSWLRSLTKNRSDIALQHLTPKYIPDDHELYVKLIEDALKPRGWRKHKAKPVRSIALSGGYGVGKSSILEEVIRRNKKRVVSISLATLGVTSNEPRSEDNADATSTTNRIQKEIVKQILYNENPNKMPGSQYQRIAKASRWRNMRIAAIISIVLTTTFYLMGWTVSLGNLFLLHLEPWILSCGLLAIMWLLALWVLHESHNRLHIDKLTAGQTALVLSKGVSTYFDEYLDEIVYFFETAKKRDIVIFEDIDRFDDPGIFENLRSLNEILNGAKQLKGRNICFIYAVKDSIFELIEKKKGSVDPDTMRTNRTKFFNLIVPVVPFVSHTSARNLMDTLMKDIPHDVSDSLIDLTSRYAPDMRLMKNIRNEFAVFKRQVVAKNGLKLPDDGIFAMVVYKNMHLGDFEKIRTGASDLDSLYRVYRDIVNDEKVRLNSLIAGNDRAIHEATTPKGQGKVYGTAFTDDAARVLRYMQTHGVRGTTPTYQYQGTAVDDTRMLSDEFWYEVAESHQAITVSYRSAYGTQSYDVQYDELQAIVGDSLDAESWKKNERKRLELQNDEARKDIDFLDCADMSDLMDRPKFKDGDKSFETIASDTLKSELAVELVRGGYIDRRYTLYTSIFHGNRVSPNAMNYIMQNVEPRRIDTAFQLSASDSKSILNERPDIIDQIAAYNTTFVDYLLAASGEKSNVQRVVERLMRNGDDERSFIYAYLESGKKAEVFVKTLAAQWAGIFTMLAAETVPLSEKDRVRYINIALRSAQTGVEYAVNSDLKLFLEISYRSLPIFTSAKTTAGQSTIMSELLNHSKAELGDIAPLGSAARGAIVSVGAYRITKENLLLAVNDPTHSLSLDDIKETDDIIYNHILDDVPAYLSAVGENIETVAENDHFASILGDVLSASESSLEQIIKQSAPKCTIDTLSDISEDVWPLLAQYRRFPLSIGNVTAYIAKYDIDERIAVLLTESNAIIVDESAEDESTKTTLAKTILAASDTLPSAELRANLVSSLSLKAYIADDDIPTETGELVGWLIGKNIASDDAETFAHIAPNDLDGLIFAIGKSTEFVNFMTTTEVKPLDVGRIVNSDLVPATVKDAIIDRFTELTAGATPSGLYLVASYARDTGKQLPVPEIQRLATEGVEPRLVITLLKPHFASIALAEITSILTALGGAYAELTERNGRHPRFAKDEPHRLLGERLIELELASSLGDRGEYLVVNMRRAA